MSRIFRKGDRVKVSKDAQLATPGGHRHPTKSAGHEGIINSYGVNQWGNYTLDVPGKGCNCNCLPEYLTLISSSDGQVQETKQEANSLYCNCNGPARETGIGMLVFSVCTICKKEKP